MDDLQNIIDRLTVNDEIARKFFMVETKILTILNFKELFDVLLSEIREKFDVPYAWISIIQKTELAKLLKPYGASVSLKAHLNSVNRNLFDEIVGDFERPVLINSNLDPFSKLFPRGEKYEIKSIAVSPLILDGEVAGSLNLADVTEQRFQPALDTEFLERLSVKVSLCLSNVVAHEKLKYLAYHDPLTDLLNRRVMGDVLRREFTRAVRYKNSLSMVFIDVNDFKRINDTHGHDIGDAYLKHVAKQLMKLCRETDIVSRFAGDEFVIILPETTLENTEKLMSRLVVDLSNRPLKHRGKTIPVSLSYGAASTEDKTIKSHNKLLKVADQKLYLAKKKKKPVSPGAS